MKGYLRGYSKGVVWRFRASRSPRGVTFGTRKQLQSEQGKAETEQMVNEHEEQKKQREAVDI